MKTFGDSGDLIMVKVTGYLIALVLQGNIMIIACSGLQGQHF